MARTRPRDGFRPAADSTSRYGLRPNQEEANAGILSDPRLLLLPRRGRGGSLRSTLDTLARNQIGVVVSAASRRLKPSGGKLLVRSVAQFSWELSFSGFCGFIFDWSSIKLAKKIISKRLRCASHPKRPSRRV